MIHSHSLSLVSCFPSHPLANLPPTAVQLPLPSSREKSGPVPVTELGQAWLCGAGQAGLSFTVGNLLGAPHFNLQAAPDDFLFSSWQPPYLQLSLLHSVLTHQPIYLLSVPHRGTSQWVATCRDRGLLSRDSVMSYLGKIWKWCHTILGNARNSIGKLYGGCQEEGKSFQVFLELTDVPSRFIPEVIPHCCPTLILLHYFPPCCLQKR